MEPGHSLIDPAAASHGVLSHFSRQHAEHLAPTDPPAFNQAGDHPHVLNHRRVPPRPPPLGPPRLGPVAGRLRGAILAGPTLVEFALPLLTRRVAVIGGAALRRRLLAVGLPAAEGAAQIAPPGIPWMGQKENATVPAPGQALAQMRLGPQYRPQEHVILQYQRGYRAPAVPVRPELKMLRDPDCKRPKLSLKMPMLNDMSPSYRIDTPVSRK